MALAHPSLPHRSLVRCSPLLACSQHTSASQLRWSRVHATLCAKHAHKPPLRRRSPTTWYLSGNQIYTCRQTLASSRILPLRGGRPWLILGPNLPTAAHIETAWPLAQVGRQGTCSLSALLYECPQYHQGFGEGHAPPLGCALKLSQAVLRSSGALRCTKVTLCASTQRYCCANSRRTYRVRAERMP
jgi:hypothetical protein